MNTVNFNPLNNPQTGAYSNGVKAGSQRNSTINTSESFQRSKESLPVNSPSMEFINFVKSGAASEVTPLNATQSTNPGALSSPSGSIASGLTGSPATGASFSSISRYTTQREHDIMVEIAGGEQNIPRQDVIKIVNGRPQKSVFVDWKDIYSKKQNARIQKHGKFIGGFLNALSKSGDKDRSVTAAMLATSQNKWKAIEEAEQQSIDDAINMIMKNSGIASSTAPRETKVEQEKRIRTELEKYIEKNPNGEMKITYGDGFVNIGGVKVPIKK